MTPDERQLITDLFKRIQATGAQQSRDKESDALINRLVQQVPYAPYFLVQSVIVQNEALEAANKKIQQLEAGNHEQGEGGGFLSSLFGGGRSAPAQSRQAPPAPYQQQAPYAAQGYAPPMGGGGFLRNALGTAAGVAGGVLLANSISSLFHDNPQGIAADMPAPDETVINNYYGDDASGSDNQDGFANAQDDGSSFDDGGGDFGDDGGSFDV